MCGWYLLWAALGVAAGGVLVAGYVALVFP